MVIASKAPDLTVPDVFFLVILRIEADLLHSNPQTHLSPSIASAMEEIYDWAMLSRRQAVRPLDVIIIGAGIAGLSTGLALAQHHHSVTILERSSELTEVGAGIQLAPNATRILRRLGVLDQVMAHISVLSGVSIRWVFCISR